MTYAPFSEADIARWDRLLGGLANIQSNASFESLPEIEGMNDTHENQSEETENNEENEIEDEIENNEEHEIDEEIVNNEGREIEEQDNPNGFENDVDQSDDSIIFLNVIFIFNVNMIIKSNYLRMRLHSVLAVKSRLKWAWAFHVAMFSTEPVLSAGSKST